MSKNTLQIRVLPQITEISAVSWDACANPTVQPICEDNSFVETSYNPFVSHAFLSSLEDSLSATAKTGWQPQHLVAEAADGAVLGVAPCYLKSHSRGEYVFDRGWAEAYERAGGNYYPKLQVSVPFTPATGRRLLAAPGPRAKEVCAGLSQGLMELCGVRDASSVHITFMPEDEWALVASQGYLQRTDQQFHWVNAGFATFDDFLAALASRKRKLIKRERRDALANGVTIECLTGNAITEAAWDSFFAFYM